MVDTRLAAHNPGKTLATICMRRTFSKSRKKGTRSRKLCEENSDSPTDFSNPVEPDIQVRLHQEMIISYSGIAVPHRSV